MVSTSFPFTPHSHKPLPLPLILCPMSTPTTWDPPSASLEQNSIWGSLLLKKLKSYVPRNTSDLTSPMRMKSPLLLPSKRWSESNFNFLMSQRMQCPHMHYHPWCNECQTLMEWEPPQPIRLTSSKSIPTFGQLKKAVRMHCQCHFEWWHQQRYLTKRACLEWREEQFQHAMVKRATQLAAQEAQCLQACQQRIDHGAIPLV